MSTEIQTSKLSSKPPGTVVTFYSFKGGVGRSMALANLAVLLARAGKRVLCIDWDLEAPGLDRYFRAVSKTMRNNLLSILPAANRKKGGLLSILESSSKGQLAPWRDYLYTRKGFDGTSLDFICSGDDAEDYSQRLGAFSWAEYFANRQGGEIIEELRKDWKAAYDYVLVDSRTGLTDSSGICTIQMPDLLIMLFAANEQNTDWSRRVAHSIREGRKALQHDRAFLTIIPLLSRFDAREESDRAAAAMDRIAEIFAPFYADWLPRSIKPRDMLAWSILPYMPRYSFEEALAVEDEPDTGAQGLTFYYQLLSRLMLGRLQGVRKILAGVGVVGATLPDLLPLPNELRAELRRDPTALQKYHAAIKDRAVEEPIEAVEAYEGLALVCAISSRFREADQLLREAINLCKDPAVDRNEEIPRLMERLAEVLAEQGRTAEALAPAQEAVEFSRVMARQNPEIFQPVLSESLNNLAIRLSGLGRQAEALAASQEAVGLNRLLALRNPDAFQPALAGSLNNQAALLSALGRQVDALALAKDAVELHRVLALRNPDAFRSNLARSLNNLAKFLNDLEKQAEALAAAQEAMELYRTLSHQDPGGFQPDLARLLNNVAALLDQLGRQAEALALTQEAVKLNRALAQQNPNAFRPALAGSLNNLAVRLMALDQSAEEPAKEAVELNRALASLNPKDFLGDLARSLGMYGQTLEHNHRLGEALAAYAEAMRALVTPFQQLPAQHAPLMRQLTMHYVQTAKTLNQPPDEALLVPVRTVFARLQSEATPPAP